MFSILTIMPNAHTCDLNSWRKVLSDIRQRLNRFSPEKTLHHKSTMDVFVTDVPFEFCVELKLIWGDMANFDYKTMDSIKDQKMIWSYLIIKNNGDPNSLSEQVRQKYMKNFTKTVEPDPNEPRYQFDSEYYSPNESLSKLTSTARTWLEQNIDTNENGEPMWIMEPCYFRPRSTIIVSFDRQEDLLFFKIAFDDKD